MNHIGTVLDCLTFRRIFLVALLLSSPFASWAKYSSTPTTGSHCRSLAAAPPSPGGLTPTHQFQKKRAAAAAAANKNEMTPSDDKSQGSTTNGGSLWSRILPGSNKDQSNVQKFQSDLNTSPTTLPAASSIQSAASTTSTTTSTSQSQKPYIRDYIYLWSSLVAGAGSGGLASIICAPLDLIRTRMQVWGELTGGQHQGARAVPGMIREIIAKEGVSGCFRGLGATLMTVPFFWGVYFPLYDDLKRYWAAQYPHTGSAWIHMGSAVMAGAVSDIICNPMFVVRTRLQTEALHSMMDDNAVRGLKPKSVIQTAQSLYREGGILIFWRGMTANLLGLSHVAVQFPVYEQLKRHFLRDKAENSPADLLVSSALSKMTASLLTYPHEVIRSRMMDARTGVGFVQTCRRIYAMEGLIGFYSGLPITLLRVLPNTCITFMSYELLLQWARSRIEEHRSSSNSPPLSTISTKR